jgi:hypothetical protein
MPLVWMTVLSPTFLPSLNLMLDVPALALSLGALVLFFRACDRDSMVLAVVAGLVAGLAMETKYTGFLAPAVMLLYAAILRQGDETPTSPQRKQGQVVPLLALRACVRGPFPARLDKLPMGIVAGAFAALLFGCWEGLIAWQYGESHFLFHLRRGGSTLHEKLQLLPPLLPILGGVAAPLVLLGLIVLVRPRHLIIAACAYAAFGLTVGYALIVLVPSDYATFTRDPESGHERLTLNNTVLGGFGIALFAVTALAARRCLQLSRDNHEVSSTDGAIADHRIVWFLISWLVLELLGYTVLTPFAAVRRIMGVVVVATLLLGRLASRSCQSRERWVLLAGVAAISVLLGGVYYWVTVRDAFAEKEAAERAAEWVRRQQPGPGAKLWFVGHWGFQYYAEQAGMKPVAPNASQLRPGDWLMVPDERHHQQLIEIDRRAATEVHRIEVGDGLPLRTVMCYFAGRAPIEHHEGPRIVVTIYRIDTDFCPPAPPPPGEQ